MIRSMHRAGAAVAAMIAAVAGSGCVAPDVPVGGPPPDRQPGTRLAQTIAEQGPSPAPYVSRPRPVVAAPIRFRSTFGHAITSEPIVHPGRSIAGRELRYWVFGSGTETVLILGGMHGDETSSTEVAYDLIEWCCDHPADLGECKVVIAPEVNPDGNAAGTRRNARDVDLNRNFPAQNWSAEGGDHGPGFQPGSEPETRFVLTLLQIYAPVRVVATHAAAACVNFDGPAEALAESMSRACGLPTTPTIGYPTPGSLGSYLGRDRDVPTITLELATKDRVGAARDDVLQALLAAIHFPHPVPATTSGPPSR